MFARFKHSPLLPVLALLPAFLGGATDRWSQGLVLCLLGLLFLARPPEESLGRAFHLVLIGLLCLAGAAFLPAHWFEIPAWRNVATHTLGLRLGSRVTPQPWITLEAGLLLAGGMAWLYYVCAQPAGIDRPRLMKFFCAGVTLFAAACLYFHLSKTPWPFWNANYQFGPFPNRNQTGDLLAIGAVLTLACIHEDIRHGKKTWIAWTGACAVVLAALVCSYSRAAVGLFFGGTVAWIICIASVRRSGPRLAVGAGVVLILWSAFLFGGSGSLNRFLPSAQGGEILSRDLRWSIHKDALSLAAASPWTGNGLGNFESQFWFFHRALGKADFHVLHPESDWIWLCVEMGWPSVLLVLAGGGLLARCLFPFGKDPGWRLRAAGGVAGMMFAIHGLVDVSGHRMGSAFPALFAFSLALRPNQPPRFPSRWLQFSFRAAGLVFCGMGAIWLATAWEPTFFPGTARVLAVKHQALQLNEAGAYAKAVPLMDEAIALTPLDWELYYNRGVATALGTPDFRSALTDFSRARYLNPVTPGIPFNEGMLWLHQKPVLALAAWQEAIHRATGTRKPMFQTMISSSAAIPGMHDSLWELARGDIDLTLTFLAEVTGKEFQQRLEAVLNGDPGLETFPPKKKQLLFRLWQERGDPAAFAAQAEAHAEWMPAGWWFAAGYDASRGDYQRAYELALHRLPPVLLPAFDHRESIDALRRAWYMNPRDFARGYALYDAQMRENHPDDALITLEKVTALPHCPPYFFSLKARLYADAANWQKAWEALKSGGFVEAPKP